MAKEKVKKPIYKKWWFWVIIVILLFGLLGSCGSDATKEETSEQTEEVAEPIAEVEEPIAEVEEPIAEVEEPEPTKEVEAEEEYIDAEEFKSILETIAQAQYGDNYKITYEEGAGYTINIWQDAISEGAAAIALGNNELIENWDVMKNSMIDLSKTATDTMHKMTGLDKEIVMVNVLNENNKENTLLSCVGGVCLYDCIDEYR